MNREAHRLCLAVFALLLCGYVAIAWLGDLRLSMRFSGISQYNLLAGAFLSGETSFPIAPSIKILDDKKGYDASLKVAYQLYDASFKNDRYYLYHGPAPALFLFAPWQYVTGRILKDAMAVWLLCSIGLFFAFAVVWETFSRLRSRQSSWGLMSLLILGLNSLVIALLARPHVYEIAIGGGYAGLMAGHYFVARGLLKGFSPGNFFLAACGYGFAAASRPIMWPVAAILFPLLLVWNGRRLAPVPGKIPGREGWRALMGTVLKAGVLASPVMLTGLGILVYNFVRFGSPFEFGQQYNLCNANYVGYTFFSWISIPHNLWLYLFGFPEVMGIFPYVDFSTYTLPPAWIPERPYFSVESILGGFLSCPVLLGLFFSRAGKKTPENQIIQSLALYYLLCGVANLLVLACFCTVSLRYEVDFLPSVILAAVLVLFERSQRTLPSVLVWFLIAWGAGVNLLIALAVRL